MVAVGLVVVVVGLVWSSGEWPVSEEEGEVSGSATSLRVG